MGYSRFALHQKRDKLPNDESTIAVTTDSHWTGLVGDG